MKQYSVIKCPANQLEKKLNDAAENEWTLISVSVLEKDNMIAVLEKIVQSETDILEYMSQQESQVFQLMSNLSKARHDMAMAAIRNMRA